MTEPLVMRTARRRYSTVCVLFWLPLGLAIAPQVLLFTERGMTMAAIAGFFAAHSLTAAALELPTGGLSDVLGRRAVLATAGLLNVVALVLVGLGTAPWLLGLGMALVGAGRALSSGPAEAWYVDTVQAHCGPDAELRTGLARGAAATSAALATGTLVGGALPWLLGLGPDLGAQLSAATSGSVLPLSVPMLLGAAVEVVFVLYVLTALREPPRPATTAHDVLRGVPATVLDGLRLGSRDGLVRRVLLSAGAAGGALATVELLTPGRAAALTGTTESGAVLFAALACAGYLCHALGSHLAPLTARLAGGSERAILVSLGGGASGVLLLGATAAFQTTASTVLAVVGYALVYLGLGAAGPSENDLLHRRVASAGRATALSVQSLALQLTAALTGLVIGFLPAGPPRWLLGGTVLLAGAVLWIRRGGPTPPAPSATPEPRAASPALSAANSAPAAGR
ncbi:MFS transporter [Streptomyces sp. AC536]|uniref:MFS transporter n=1 Tax=Streptomyces buecherae TaxID=2763006 RepID=UPI00164D8EF5|nr:MFS transporter [Streptomyces buecherae]MBC3986820.1 MFS transporter [Streptomyces buecherae]QNJ38700.1 MFS transporter [Streptomyces buecherae]